MGLHLVTGYAGEEHVTSADQGSYNAGVVAPGEYVLERGNKFAASIITNNKIRILDGDILMQGRHIRLNENTYEELDIENGNQGMKRKDLVVVRYTKNSISGIENATLEVIKGTPSSNNAEIPEYTSGDILGEHVLLNEMPLYRVEINGLSIEKLVQVYDTMPTHEMYAILELGDDISE